MLYVPTIWHNSINSLVYSRLGSNMTHPLQWQKFPVLDQGFICLVDVMGDDAAIVQAARVSYGKDEQGNPHDPYIHKHGSLHRNQDYDEHNEKIAKADRQLVRYLMNHSHTTPFEMVEIKFMVQVPMDAWRQWVRHRTANINEYSTRYTEALDFMQQTDAAGWRLQAADNKQGSSGFLEEWPEEAIYEYDPVKNASSLRFKDNCSLTELDYNGPLTPGQLLSFHEDDYHFHAKQLYDQRLLFGIAKEQARKDLPLSTYTRAYWKCDLHNIFNFLRLRMDSHAQLEIRTYANAMYEIVKQICPVACEAFEDYVLHAKKFSRMEMEVIRSHMTKEYGFDGATWRKPESMTNREWKEFLNKLT